MHKGHVPFGNGAFELAEGEAIDLDEENPRLMGSGARDRLAEDAAEPLAAAEGPPRPAAKPLIPINH